MMQVDIENVAEAVHNAWWKEKLRQGCANHPDMVPYGELPENVKEYDRATARAVIGIVVEMESENDVAG